MTDNDKRLCRLACTIHEQWTAKHEPSKPFELPRAACEELRRVTRQLQLARQKHWRFAEANLSHVLYRSLHHLRTELTSIEEAISRPSLSTSSCTPTEIHADLVALQEEFEGISFDRRAHTLSVTTEPIQLEEVFLGPFEIRLDWSTVFDPNGPRYRVIALDPHAAASNDSVTHPHVQSESLCEGDGHQPIRSALKQGRLLDYFLLVANILRTYNGSSPYVSLEDWYGVDCADCGSTIHDDERWSCEKCGTTLCDSCVYTCHGCEGSLCNECTETCSSCKEYFCRSCLNACSNCESDVCSECLHENETCTDCHKRQTEEEVDAREEEDPEPPTCADTPLHSHGLGETPVLA